MKRIVTYSPNSTAAEFYRRRIAELQAALLKAQTEAGKEKIQQELDLYLKEIGNEDKAAEDKNAKTA